MRYAICIPCAWPARKRPFAICSLFICSQGIPCPAVARRTFQWLDAEKDEAVLAAAYTQVSNHAGRLLCLLEDSGRDVWLEYAYERWAEVEDALFLRMLDILARENDRGAKHALRGKGRRFLLAPLMRRNDCTDESWTAVGYCSARRY